MWYRNMCSRCLSLSLSQWRTWANSEGLWAFTSSMCGSWVKDGMWPPCMSKCLLTSMRRPGEQEYPVFTERSERCFIMQVSTAWPSSLSMWTEATVTPPACPRPAWNCPAVPWEPPLRLFCTESRRHPPGTELLTRLTSATHCWDRKRGNMHTTHALPALSFKVQIFRSFLRFSRSHSGDTRGSIMLYLLTVPLVSDVL